MINIPLLISIQWIKYDNFDIWFNFNSFSARGLLFHPSFLFVSKKNGFTSACFSLKPFCDLKMGKFTTCCSGSFSTVREWSIWLRRSYGIFLYGLLVRVVELVDWRDWGIHLLLLGSCSIILINGLMIFKIF